MTPDRFIEYDDAAFILDRDSWRIFRLSVDGPSEKITDPDFLVRILCRGTNISEEVAMRIARSMK